MAGIIDTDVSERGPPCEELRLTVRLPVPVIVAPFCAVVVATKVAVQLVEGQPATVAKPDGLMVATPGAVDTQVT